jgi:putative acetyltransferase
VSDTSTLTVRGQRSDDVEELFALLNVEQIVHNSVELPYISEDAFRERFASSAPNTHTLIIEASLPGGRKRLVGVAWLAVLKLRLRHVGQISLAIHPEYYEAGAAATLLRAVLDLADRTLGLHRLEARVCTDDDDTLELYATHGFDKEATMRRFMFRDGDYADAHLVARLRTMSHTAEVDRS